MKVHRSIFALAGALTLAAATSADAVPTSSFFDLAGFDLDLNGAPTLTQPITIGPGGSFTVQLRIDIDAIPTIGFDYELTVAELAGSGKIALTGRDNTGSVFSDYLVTNAILFAGSNAVLDPSTANLGALITDIFSPLPDDTYVVADLTFFLDPSLAPGLYTISAPGFLTNDQFDSIPITANPFQVQVIPEPNTAFFGIACLGAVAGLSRQRKLRE